MTAIIVTARSPVRERSRLCIEETIAFLSVAVDLQEKLGCSQGNLADEAFESEQPPTAETIAALEVAMLKQTVPSMYKSAKLRINLVDFCRMTFKCCLVS